MKVAILLMALATVAQAGNEIPGGNQGGDHGHHGGFGGGVAGGFGGNGGGGGFGGSFGSGIPAPTTVGTVNNGGAGVSPGGVVAGVARGGIVAGVAPGGTVQGGNGGSIARGAVNNATTTNNSLRYPVQAPPIIGYGSYSQASCMGSFGASGSGGAGGGGLLLPWESDQCNIRLNSAHMAAQGRPKTACYIMVDNIDYVGEANEKAPDENCSNAKTSSVAMPVPGSIVPVATPTLDYLMPPGHKHPEIVQMIDNQHDKAMSK